MNSKLLFWVLFYGALALIAPLLRKGGAARKQQGRTVFPLRPGMKVVSYLLLAMGIYGFTVAWGDVQGGDRWFVWAVAGLMCLGGLYSLSTSYIVDEDGIRFRRLGITKTISWNALDHYERLSVPRMGSRQIFFRGTDGQTIGIDELGQDAAAMLDLVLAKRHLHERPYKRQHWWGG